MNLVLGFLPFILFAVVMTFSTDLALWLAFAAAFTLTIRSFLDTRVLKTLDTGSMVLFGLLALYKGFAQPMLSFSRVLLAVDGGLLAIIAGSLLLHEPFTLQYARDQVAPELWRSPDFVRPNYIVTFVWLGAFLAMTAADAIAIFQPLISAATAAAIDLVVTAAALTFSLRYPARARLKA